MTTFPKLLLAGTSAACLLLLAACSKPPEPAVVPAAATTTIGTAIDDTVLTGTVKAALLSDPGIKSFEFKVETRKGEVQLSGFVDDQAQVDRATAVARSVTGVVSVDNRVSFKGAPTTVGREVDDSVVTTRVKTALLADENVKSSDIAVATRKGEVQLSGFVDSQNQIDRAVIVARGAEGVQGVRNELAIKK